MRNTIKNCLCRIIVFGLLAVLMSAGLVYGEDAEPVSDSRSLFAMDTYMTLTAYGDQAKDALDAAEAEIKRLDELLSTGNTESEIYQLNLTGNALLSEDSAYLLTRSLAVNELTNGAFNPLIYPLMEAWGFTDKDYQVPDQETIERLLPLLDISALSFDPSSREIHFEKDGMKIDFGGIAKGYTSSRIMEIFQEYGIEYAVISLGGNVHVLGTKPNGNPWKIAIQDPYDGSAYVGILDTIDNAVVTSGGYERNFEQDGVLYHHILDPENGYPADKDLVSVSVITNDGTLADALSTSMFVMGVDAATELWRQNSDLFEAIFLTKDNIVYITEGISDLFRSYYPAQIISQ